MFTAVILIFIIIIILVLAFKFSGSGKDNELAEAITHFNDNNDEKAIDMFRTLSLSSPKDVRHRWYLSQLYFRKQDYILALKECVGITINKYATPHDKAEAYALMIEIYVEQDMIDKALKIAIEGIKVEPRNTSLHFQMGKLYTKTEKEEKAIKEFNVVLAFDRTHIPARLFLARIHHKKREEHKAIFQYKRIQELEPNNRDANFELAKIYFDKGDLELSQKELLKINTTEGIEVDFAYMISSYYQKIGDSTKAKEAMEKVAYLNDVKNDKLVRMRYDLGVIYEEHGELEKAYDLYARVKLESVRYKDVDNRVNKLKKILYPEEYAKLIQMVDYNSLSNIEFEEMYAKVISKLNYKEFKMMNKSRNGITAVCVERFSTSLQGKTLIQMLRSFDRTGDIEFNKFAERINDDGCEYGIMISTSQFTDYCLELAENYSNIKLVDKMNIYELLQ